MEARSNAAKSASLVPVFPTDPVTPIIFAMVRARDAIDRKSTRLNSSHVRISYAVFCLKKKNKSRDIMQHHRTAHDIESCLLTGKRLHDSVREYDVAAGSS